MGIKNNFNRLLNLPDRGITRTHGANGVLSRLFRIMWRDLGIDIPRGNSLMTNYIMDPRNGIPRNKKDQAVQRGNLTKEFIKEQMTWKVFLKGMRFLQLKKIKFTVEATHWNDRITIHSTDVNLGSPRHQHLGTEEVAVDNINDADDEELVTSDNPGQEENDETEDSGR